ncbi:MAG: hypothetical protein SFY80_09790 [Verrucomicrobiota bacterium]|nr:hypothetical protein [Verrucomicrobiota bacterium]
MHRSRKLAAIFLAGASLLGFVVIGHGQSANTAMPVEALDAGNKTERGAPETTNIWPFVVWRAADAYTRPEKVSSAGPIFSVKQYPGLKVTAVRPVYARFDDSTLGEERDHLFYPFFNHKQRGPNSNWDLLGLMYGERMEQADGSMLKRFELWPIFWSYDTGKAESSYWAFMPFYGELKHRLFADNIKFAMFPFYLRVQTRDEVNTSMPWPFIQILSGPQSRGLSIWPFFGHTERTNKYDHFYALWPLIYDKKDDLDQPVPSRRFGVLPFYTRETGAGLKSETYVWPFFGYTEESAPRKTYDETRYFWPFFVQGRGEEKSINRWMPFYTHETAKDYTKTWYLWPLLKQTAWESDGLQVKRDQFLYFLWWDERQTALRGNSDFFARKTHLWPLFSYWNNGAGTRQFQTLSPLEVFYPHNEVIREKYSPLFALYRYDHRPQSTTHSVLWDMISVENSGSEGVFQIGPLFELNRNGDHAYAELLKGFIGYGVEDGTRKLKFLWTEW